MSDFWVGFTIAAAVCGWLQVIAFVRLLAAARQWLRDLRRLEQKVAELEAANGAEPGERTVLVRVVPAERVRMPGPRKMLQ